MTVKKCDLVNTLDEMLVNTHAVDIGDDCSEYAQDGQLGSVCAQEPEDERCESEETSVDDA